MENYKRTKVLQVYIYIYIYIYKPCMENGIIPLKYRQATHLLCDLWSYINHDNALRDIIIGMLWMLNHGLLL